MNQNVLEAKDLNKSYSSAVGARTAVLQGINLDVLRGEFVAIVGASGAGKSTLLHLLGALESPDSGQIRLLSPHDGGWVDYAKASDDELASLRNTQLGFVFQFHHLLPEFTAQENVMMPSLIAGVARSEAARHAAILMERVGLADKRNQKPDSLSGGEQQRVAFARALINKPSLVLADEPTGNLDDQNSSILLELLQELRQELGQAFVVVTHSEAIARQADRTFILQNGRSLNLSD